MPHRDVGVGIFHAAYQLRRQSIVMNETINLQRNGRMRSGDVDSGVRETHNVTFEAKGEGLVAVNE